MRICDACRRREERGALGLRAYIVKIQGPVCPQPSARPSVKQFPEGQHGELGTYELCEGCHERLIAAVRDAVDRVMNATRAEGDTKGAGHAD
jgi:hypothetical protein